MIEINKTMKLSEHFTLGEVTKTSHKTADGNIPSRVAIENLRNLCENWLEALRQAQGPIVINSAYRSEAVNKAVGGAPTSNHLTGCAADIRVSGIEQAVRYAVILIDISDESGENFDELYIERNSKGNYWIHFAVRPKDNRRKMDFLKV